MAVEKDDWLPEPPPPRPARRDAAIEVALRKFEGAEDSAPAARERPRRSWASTHRPQLAVLVSAMLVVVVGIPAALIGISNQPSTSVQPPPPERMSVVEPAPSAERSAPVSSAEVKAPLTSEPPVRSNATAAMRRAPATGVASSPEPPSPAPAPMVAAPPPPPPPPPSVADQSQAAAQTLIVTGSRIPRAPAAERSAQAKAAERDNKVAADSPDVAYAAFLSRLQAVVRAGNRSALIALIDFPLRVNEAGGSRLYRDARSVERSFGRIFTPKVRRAILGQRADRLFVRDQGAMIGDGELWFEHTCPTATCSPPGPVRIMAVNP